MEEKQAAPPRGRLLIGAIKAGRVLSYVTTRFKLLFLCMFLSQNRFPFLGDMH